MGIEIQAKYLVEEAISVRMSMLASLVATRGMHDNVCRERSSSASSCYEGLEKHHLGDQKTGRLLAVTVENFDCSSVFIL